MKTIHDRTYQIFVECLRAGRRAANITQVDLAHALGTDQSYVSKYERLERRLDVIETRAICKVLDINFPDFIVSLEKKLKECGLS